MIQFLRPVNYANFNVSTKDCQRVSQNRGLIQHAHTQYNAYFAPWMLYDLPTNTSPENDGYSSIRANRYDADIDPKDRSCSVTLYGAPLRITPPLLVHAGLLLYFARFEKRSFFESLGMGMNDNNYGNGLRVPNFEQQSANFTFRLPHLKDSTLYDTDFHRYVSMVHQLFASVRYTGY